MSLSCTMNVPRLPALLPAVLLCLSLSAPAQTASAAPPQLKALPNGIELTSGTTILQVTALRDDVLRVRASHSGQLPEDASWAVLPEARTSTVAERSEERRVGKECPSKCRSRWSPYH